MKPCASLLEPVLYILGYITNNIGVSLPLFSVNRIVDRDR